MKQESTGMKSVQMDQLARIWAIVEARNTLPTVIIVTCATKGDDTESIARGLAQAAHGAGQRVGYLGLRNDGGERQPSTAYDTLSIGADGSRRESFDAALVSWRTMYDVVIADAALFLGSDPLGLHAARVSDGVIVAVSDQRRVESADRDLTRILAEIHASVMGVVITAPLGGGKVWPVLRDQPRLEPVIQR
jgi:Mrp family chromosome partitioning ATPase